MAGKLDKVGNFVARGEGKVDPILVDILQKAAELTGMNVEAYSGYRPGDKRQHGKGSATDVRIIGPDGKALENYQSPETFPQYEQLAQAARAVQMEHYPELDKQFRWGGYFSGGKGKYGAMDLMHFDVGGSDKLGMAGGTWENGLNQQQLALFPGVKSTGAMAFNGEAPQNGGLNAIAALTSEAPMQSQQRAPLMVSPPFAANPTGFAPLFNTNSPAAQPAAQPSETQAIGQTEPQQAEETPDDILRAFLPSDTAPDTEGQQQPKSSESDDDILKSFLPPEVSPAASMELAKEAAPSPSAAAPSTGEDVLKSGAAGLARGAIGVATLPGTIADLANSGLDWAKSKAYETVTGDKPTSGFFAPMDRSNMLLAGRNPLGGDVVGEAATKATDGAIDYKGKTVAGQYAGTVGEFVPGAVVAPGNLLANVVKYGVLPAVSSETAGQVTKGTDAEPYARVAAAVTSPFVAEGALRAASGLGNKLASVTPSGAAAANLKESLAASGSTVDDIATQMAANNRLTAMDVDPNIQQMAMNLANQGGTPRAILNSAVENRLSGAKGAVDDAFDAAIGGVPDVKVYLDGLKSTTATNAKKAFGDALTGAKPVDVSPVLESIDNAISPGINGVVSKASDIPQGPVEQALARVRAKLANGNEVLTDAERLHTIQSSLRTEADTLAKSASGQDKLVAAALRKVRGKIVDQIDDATGGKFKPAQRQFADDSAIQDAFDKGREVFKNGTGDAALENRPEYWIAWKKDATPAELDAAKVGARVAVDQTIRGVRNAAQKGAAIGDVDLNMGRLEVLLGKQEAGKLASILKDEQKIAQTNAKIFAGSQTAPRQAVNKLTEVKQVTPGISLTTPMAGGIGFQVGGIPGAAAGVGLSLGRMGLQAGMKARDVARNRLMAEAISGGVTGLRDAVAPNSLNRLASRFQSAQSPLLNKPMVNVPATIAGQNALTQSRERR